ncbi:MAG: SufBD protein [Parcubacteria group bacterium LiPW_30]|nr:MAG: SufBD protein [Parcubacteria group bacterium LiPW_30]
MKNNTKIILNTYVEPNAFKYGLKIASSFSEEFLGIIAKGGEVIEVAPNETKKIENNLSQSKLLIVYVGEGATFEYVESSKSQVVGKNDIHIILAGRGAKASITSSYDFVGESEVDIYHKIYHEASHTISKIDVRGVLKDKAHVIYRSDIAMGKEIEAKGEESASFLILSEEARVDAIPSLDIASNDVRCSHSLSIKDISRDELFYPMSRGLDEENSYKLLVDGFLEI